jgi:hypothetical protein
MGFLCGLNFAYPFLTVRARTSDSEQRGNNKSRRRRNENMNKEWIRIRKNMRRMIPERKAGKEKDEV